MRELDPLISAYEHLKGKSREADALKTLQKVASLVKPIMRQRGWKVGVLTEFYPPEKNLLGLNWNRGEKICLRLRYPYDETQFIPMEEVVDTMLHELCHIVHGPHNDAFNALWNQLREEHEQLSRKGYTGEGFLSAGHRLGGKTIPMDEARRRARAAAEKRRILSQGSGQKLGGAPVLRGTDMRKVIADAATRRITVTRGCASGSKESQGIAEQASRNGFRTQAEEDDANERAIMQAYIELLQEEEREKYGSSYTPPSAENPQGRAATSPDAKHLSSSSPKTTEAPSFTTHTPPQHIVVKKNATATTPLGTSTVSDHAKEGGTSKVSDAEVTWTCSACTLVNPANFLCCDACGTERPPDISTRMSTAHTPVSKKRSHSSRSITGQLPPIAREERLGWNCHFCGTFMESQWWTCSNCGTMKLSS